MGRRFEQAALALALSVAGLALLPLAASASGGTWSLTADMQTISGFNSAVRLQDGRVLVVGFICCSRSIAEVYDPSSATWTRQGDLNRPRGVQTMTLLRDGRVLVAGGEPAPPHNTSELFDPVKGAWTLTGELNVSRRNAQAAVLPDGRVLVAGGLGSPSGLRDAEIYDPDSGEWTLTGSMVVGRFFFGMTSLQDGTVLAAGGFYDLNSSELFDPVTGTWTQVGDMSEGSEAPLHLLNDGRVLAIHRPTADLYDPSTQSWRATAGPRGDHFNTVLSDGRVLGSGSTGPVLTSEIFDPLTETWQETGPMQMFRQFHSATLLDDGTVLAAGGGNEGPPCNPEGGCTFYPLRSAEIFMGESP